MLALEASATLPASAPELAITITPKKLSYVVVLDKNGNPIPPTYPILEFDIVGPPGYAVDIQVSRDDSGSLVGGPGLSGAWDRSKIPGERIKHRAFSSFSDGDKTLVFDSTGYKNYKVPLEWWQDLARLPLQEFGNAALYYRAVASPSFGATPTAWSAKDGAPAQFLTVFSNLMKFEVVGTYIDVDATKSENMRFTVRQPGTTGMYTLVQWRLGSSKAWAKEWANPHYDVAISYGLEHLLNDVDWTIDATREDPRYVDSLDAGTAKDFYIPPDGLSATTNDTPGGLATIPIVTHNYYSMDFRTCVHLNCDVPQKLSSMTLGIFLTDSKGTIYLGVKGTMPDPQPLTIAEKAWDVHILQTRQINGKMKVTHDPAFSGPPP